MTKKDDKTGDGQDEKMIRVYDDHTVTINDCAKLMGVTSNTIRFWIKNGLHSTHEKRGTSSRVSISDLIDFKAQEKALKIASEETGDSEYDYGKSKARLEHMKADIQQMKRDREARKIVDIDDVAEVVETDYANVRSAVMNLPGRLSVALASMTDTREIYSHVRKQCEDILDEMTQIDDIGNRKKKKKFIGDEPDDSDVDEDLI